jgi:hypothetical protein
MGSTDFPYGMTVAELKALVNRWPDSDEHGQPLSVWVGTGGEVFRPIVRATSLSCNEATRVIPHLMLHSDA